MLSNFRTAELTSFCIAISVHVIFVVIFLQAQRQSNPNVLNYGIQRLYVRLSQPFSLAHEESTLHISSSREASGSRQPSPPEKKRFRDGSVGSTASTVQKSITETTSSPSAIASEPTRQIIRGDALTKSNESLHFGADENNQARESASEGTRSTERSLVYDRSNLRNLIPPEAPAVPESVAPSALQAQILGKNVARSIRADCSSKYASNGLLAIPLIAADHLRENGCRFSK
jgi:hypothetical protein